MFYSKIVFWLLTVFFISVWFAPSLALPPFVWLALPVILIVAIYLPLRFRIIFLAGFFLLLGNLIFWAYRAHYSAPAIENLYQTELFGILSADPKPWGSGYQQKVFIPEINRSVFVTSATDYGLEYGDRIKFTCLKGMASEDLPKDRVIGRCNAPGIKVIDRNQGNPLLAQVYRLKNFLNSQIDNSLTQPQSALLAGLLFGGNQGLSKEWVEKFRNAGVSHIMAVSGFNVMIVISGVLVLLAPLYLSRKRLFLVITFCLILFILLTGLEPSIIRAVVMAWIILIAKTLGRYLNLRNLLMFSAFVMVFANPYVLRYDLGFQLSFAATAGLMFGAPWLAKKLKIEKIPWDWLQTFISGYLLPSMVAYLVTMPIIIIAFGKVSLVAPLVNIIIAPLVPLGMALGGLLLLFAGLPGLGSVLAMFNWLILSAILQVVSFFGK